MKQNEKTRTDLVREVIDGVFEAHGKVQRRLLVTEIENKLSMTGLTNIICSHLDKEFKKGKYKREEGGSYYLNPSYVKKSRYFKVLPYDGAELQKVLNQSVYSISDEMNLMAKSLLDAQIDGVAVNTDKYAMLKNLSTILNSCIAYIDSEDTTDLKNILTSLK